MQSLNFERLAARVVVPVLDLRVPEQRAEAWARAREQVGWGVGGLILFGGEAADVKAGLAELRASRAEPLVVGSDLERGLGQQVLGGSALPPLLALGAADDEGLAERAGEALGREALGVGIDWIYAPVLDLADEPRNPIVGARALGADPQRVSRLGAAFVRGIEASGARACGKHFPGHGGTLLDSHAADPRVDYAATALRERDLAPFAAAVGAEVSSFMSAHVAYPSLDGETPATRSHTILVDVLREELGFKGAVVSDALMMDGVRAGGLNELDATCEALAAGCDLLLYPSDPRAAIEAVAAWAQQRDANAARLQEAVARVETLASTTARGSSDESTAACAELAATSAAVADEVASAALTRWGPAAEPLGAGASVAVLVLDDDDVPTLGHALTGALLDAGVEVRLATLGPVPAGESATPESRQGWQDAAARWDALASSAGRCVVVIGCQVRAWKERPGLGPELLQRAQAITAPASVVALCGPTALDRALPSGLEVLFAYGDAPSLERAAAKVLLGAPAPGTLPTPAPGHSER